MKMDMAKPLAFGRAGARVQPNPSGRHSEASVIDWTGPCAQWKQDPFTFLGAQLFRRAEHRISQQSAGWYKSCYFCWNAGPSRVVKRRPDRRVRGRI